MNLNRIFSLLKMKTETNRLLSWLTSVSYTHLAINLLSEAGINTKIIKMSGAKDPDEFIKKFGATRFKMLLDDSEGAVNFELEKCLSLIHI